MKALEHHLLPEKAQMILIEAQKRCEAMGNRFGRDQVLRQAIAEVRRLWPERFVDLTQEEKRHLRVRKTVLQLC